MIKAVIFDMDGVLIDTEKYFVEAWQEAAHFCGVPQFGREHALMLRSMDAKFAEPAMKDIFGEEFPFKEIRMKRRELMQQKLAPEDIEAKEGAAEAIWYLQKKGYKIAIATASDFVRAVRYLTGAGLMKYIDRTNIICATELENGKPYPDIYLYACAKLGEKPEECIGVEDSPNGILSASRAGLNVVMVPDMTEPDEKLEQLLYKKLDSLEELKGLL
jgi:HAD superfamily hydrolase (TIGR01509 family)